MRLYNDVIQESHLVYGDHTEPLNININDSKSRQMVPTQQSLGSLVLDASTGEVVVSVSGVATAYKERVSKMLPTQQSLGSLVLDARTGEVVVSVPGVATAGIVGPQVDPL